MMINLTNPNPYVVKENDVLFRFAQELKQYCRDEVSVLKDVDITEDLITVDAIIDFHGMIVAVIEVVQNEDYVGLKRRDVAKIMKRAHAPLGIVVTESGKYYLRNISKTRAVRAKISTIAEEVQAIYRTFKENLEPVAVKQKLLEMFDASPIFDQKEQIRTLFENACDHLSFNRGSICFQKKDEEAIVLTLLGGKLPADSKLCRYTSLDSVFKMLQSNKHAMCSPVSMNDPHEGEYANGFMPWNVKRPRGEVEVEADNSYFLLSCSDISEWDVLTMWRLYGDDAKGACLEYVVEADKIDNDKYFLGRVSYGRKDSKTGKVSHPELEFIAYMQKASIEPGWYFAFAEWYIWKYFFKSWTYRDENEIRLIYLPDISDENEFGRLIWYKDQTNGIFNRMALIPIENGVRADFPLLLSRIILGPHSPEVRRNKEQINYMAQIMGINTTGDFQVMVSAIDNYR